MKRQGLFFTIAVAIVLLLTFSSTLIHLLTESWWFQAVGFESVFWTRLTWQVGIWIVTFLIYGGFIWLNYRLAMHFSRDRGFQWLEQTEIAPYADWLVRSAALFATLAIALVAASASVADWETLLKFLNPSQFDLTDPIYGNDIGFYLFRLPFYEELQAWLLSLLGWGLVIAAAIYSLKGAINLGRGWTNLLTGDVKLHLGILLAAIAFLLSIGFWLQRYELLYSPSGVVYGAGYTDIHARLQSYWVMGFITLALGFLFVASLWRSGFTLATYGILFYIAVFILVGGVYPWFQQQFVVEPNELAKESPYIEHNIAFTRNAYRLDEVQQDDYPANDELTRQDIEASDATIRNIRLWDYRPLLSTYRQLQEIRAYYRFNDVDIDRYTFDGNYRQVMLSPRELDTSLLSEQAQNWLNQRLQYTHGYGLTMSPVNVVRPDGLPEFFVQDIPPETSVDLNLDEVAVYYGELTDDYIFTGASIEEFDYPQGDTNASTTYDGEGGVPIGSPWRRLAYAWDMSDLKIFISNYFTSNSKVHYHRQILERVNQVAPFLQFDTDPYITVVDGRLQWIIDAYTISDRYPYSEPIYRAYRASAVLRGDNNAPGGDVGAVIRDRTNYIRNSVKVVVDAFNGTMQFYTVDESDPILSTYRKIFPDLFLGMDAVPPQVRDHFRYPLDLFKIQALMYLSYHMDNPDVFYNQEDLWRFPTEVYEGNQQIMEPYYVIMNLPGGDQEEFILILPFTPVSKDNMIAWMAARSDGENYGRLLLYEFPKQELVYGPSQIEARIDQTPEISQQLTLWSQEGSRVIRGDLLVIPIQESLLYVEPIYLRAEQGELPELKRVIVAYQDGIVMRETLDQALTDLFGVGEPSQAEPPEDAAAPDQPEAAAPPADAASLAGLIDSAQTAYENAQDALQQGDWAAYGRYQNELNQILNQLDQQTNTTAAPAPETPTPEAATPESTPE
jgi:hypothetical protein